MLGIGARAQAQQPPAQAAGRAAQDPVAALKQSLREGMARIRQYEWVETAAISLKGEEQSRKQNRCCDGADRKVQMNALPDGAVYVGKTTLEAKARNITVVVQNSGHRPISR